ncbi:SGNH/GDSL hydrolase family protein [Nocardia asteroides]|uniref:SGNH/GDSL hydrolase family protein n=1 Tax=Nocardia asteroides TaxID=1824 RepID=UPI001E5D4E48|nr:SGNH/GDSL hydrolase family protein [Nocardia asteroides]UGT57182.1 SGNH/GDSL hydrolase family protein [Nocardia asteroides]
MTTLARAVAVLLATFALVACGDTTATREWTGAWAAAAQHPATAVMPNWSMTGFAEQTVRQVVRLSAGGPAVRIRLSNQYGAAPLAVAGATLARSAGGAAVVPDSVRPLRLVGARSFEIAAGAEVSSDDVDLPVSAGEAVTVTLYFAAPTGPATQHAQAVATSYRAQGDRTADPSATAFTESSQSWYYLTGVDAVETDRPGDVVVAFGDSITDGYRSGVDADQRYPDHLARSLAAAGGTGAVVNAGISGNRLLTDSAVLGESGLTRFRRDVLAQPGVDTVVVLIGINDIGLGGTTGPDGVFSPQVSAEQLVTGYRHLIGEAHAAGIRVVGATLLPFAGSPYYAAAKERVREEVNSWIRTSGAFDAVVDLARAMADPADGTRLAPAFDSGDHLHPNNSGYGAMASVTGETLSA